MAARVEERNGQRVRVVAGPPIEIEGQGVGEGVLGGARRNEQRKREVERSGRRAPPPVEEGHRTRGGAGIWIGDGKRPEQRERPAETVRGIKQGPDRERTGCARTSTPGHRQAGKDHRGGGPARVVLEVPIEGRDDPRLGGGAPEVPIERGQDSESVRATLRPVEEQDLAERSLAVIEVRDVGAGADGLAATRIAVALARTVVVAAAARGRRGRRHGWVRARRRSRLGHPEGVERSLVLASVVSERVQRAGARHPCGARHHRERDQQTSRRAGHHRHSHTRTLEGSPCPPAKDYIGQSPIPSARHCGGSIFHSPFSRTNAISPVSLSSPFWRRTFRVATSPLLVEPLI